MKKSVSLILILFFVISLGFCSPSLAQSKENYIIVYDEAHLQYFTHDKLSIALSTLNDTFDTSHTDVTIQLVINKENFTTSNLQGADLVLITNPNLRDDGTSNVIQNEEAGALRVFMESGGSVFYMLNPFSVNSSLSGHVDPMNKLVSDSSGSLVSGGSFSIGASASTIDPDNGTIVINDIENDGNNSHIYLNQNNIQSDIWKSEINEINQILYYGSSISQTGTNRLRGNTSSLTYSISKDYEIKAGEVGDVIWMAGSTIGENDGRGLLIGSTIMFSDYIYENETAWVEVADNQELFENLIAWLLEITPLNVPEDTIDRDFDYYLRQNIFWGIIIPVALVVLIFGMLLRNHTITFERLLEFRTKSKGVDKEVKKKAKKKAKKTTKKSGKKAIKKRRRRT